MSTIVFITYIYIFLFPFLDQLKLLVIAKLILQRWHLGGSPPRRQPRPHPRPVSQVCLTVTQTEYKIVKSRARTLSLIGGGVEPLGAEEEELKGCRARGETVIPLIFVATDRSSTAMSTVPNFADAVRLCGSQCQTPCAAVSRGRGADAHTGPPSTATLPRAGAP